MTNTDDSIVAARDMYLRCLQDSLTPFIISLFREMFGQMPKNKRTLRNLQMQLREVKTWNGHQVKEIVDNIIKSQGREYYEELLTAILVSNAEILSTISVVKNPAKINLKIPKLENYIHECIINVARALYKNAFLFDENASSLQRQRHNNEFVLLVKDAIQFSVQQILPIQDIIKQYITGAAGVEDESDVFVPDDDVPSPVESLLDPSPGDDMRHGDEEDANEAAPESIEINEPAEVLEEAIKQSNEPVVFLDDEIEAELDDDVGGESKGDSRDEGGEDSGKEREKGMDTHASRSASRTKDTSRNNGQNEKNQGFSLVHRSGSGLFVEDESSDAVRPSKSPDVIEEGADIVAHVGNQASVDNVPPEIDGEEIADNPPESISREEKLSRLMLPKVKRGTTPPPVVPAPLSDSDDDLSLYGLSDGNTNWSDDDNEFAYTDDEILTTDGEDEDEDDGEDIDTMINRIRTASKDTDASDVKITSPTEVVEAQTTNDDSPATPKSDVSDSMDIQIDLPNPEGDDFPNPEDDNGDHKQDSNSVDDELPFQEVKTIHIEDSRSKPKSKKQRKSRKAKKPVILFPDAASEDECV